MHFNARKTRNIITNLRSTSISSCYAHAYRTYTIRHSSSMCLARLQLQFMCNFLCAFIPFIRSRSITRTRLSWTPPSTAALPIYDVEWQQQQPGGKTGGRRYDSGTTMPNVCVCISHVLWSCFSHSSLCARTREIRTTKNKIEYKRDNDDDDKHKNSPLFFSLVYIDVTVLVLCCHASHANERTQKNVKIVHRPNSIRSALSNAHWTLYWQHKIHTLRIAARVYRIIEILAAAT